MNNINECILYYSCRRRDVAVVSLAIIFVAPPYGQQQFSNQLATLLSPIIVREGELYKQKKLKHAFSFLVRFVNKNSSLWMPENCCGYRVMVLILCQSWSGGRNSFFMICHSKWEKVIRQWWFDECFTAVVSAYRFRISGHSNWHEKRKRSKKKTPHLKRQILFSNSLIVFDCCRTERTKMIWIMPENF